MKCLPCKGYRNTLHAITARINESKTVTTDCMNVSSHVNYIHLSSPDKKRRLSTMHQALRTCQRQISRLRTRLSEVTAVVGEVMSQDTHESLVSIMAENESSIYKNFPPNSFGRIFWDQQKKAAALSNGMRWHPLMIKWCIHLRHL